MARAARSPARARHAARGDGEGDRAAGCPRARRRSASASSTWPSPRRRSLLTGLLVLEVTASASLAVIAGGALALQPKLIAHAQNNPKDLPGLVRVHAGRRLIVVRLEARPSGAARARRALRRSGSRSPPGCPRSPWCRSPPSSLLAPRARRRRRRARAIAARERDGLRAARGWRWSRRRAGDGVRVVAVAVVRRRSRGCGQIASRLAEFPTGFDVLYFGRLYPSNALPWHYTLGSVLVATPLVVIALAILGRGRAWRGRQRSGAAPPRRAGAGVDREPARARRRRRAFTTTACGTCSRCCRRSRSWRRWAPIALRVAIDRALRRSRRRRARRPPAPSLVLALPALAIAIDLARLHPYQDAYLAWPAAPAASRARASACSRSSTGEGRIARWRGGSTSTPSRGAVVLAPIAPHCLEPYLRSDLDRARAAAPATRREPRIPTSSS